MSSTWLMVRWRYQPPLWVFPPPTRGRWPCTTVLGNALGDMYGCGNLRAVEKGKNLKIYVEVSCKLL